MTADQITIFAVLALAIAAFLWGRWRHDVVALAALLASVLAGLVPPAEAFAGFGHPAVITVACVLVLSRGLQTTGAIDVLAHRVVPRAAGPTRSIAGLALLGAVLSAFMNNVGAMALLMPLAIQVADKCGLPPGKVLMPLAFGTILGGMTTLIGTPPNLIVSGFRAEMGPAAFGMFDFTPVGLGVAAVGVAFVALLGWRLVPRREPAGAAGFDTGTYLTEVQVAEGGRASGETLATVEEWLAEADAQIVGMVRNEFRVTAPNPRRVLHAGDILVIEAEPEDLAAVSTRFGLELGGEEPEDGDETAERPRSEDAKQPEASPPPEEEQQPSRPEVQEVILQEFAAMPGARVVGRSASDLHLRTRHGLNLLAISRRGRRFIQRLRSAAIQAGDVVLLQGPPEALAEFAAEFGCVPLAERSIRIPDRTRATTATVVMGGAIAAAALGWLPAAVSFALGVLVFMVAGVVSPRGVYDAVDWSVVVLLGALIPVAEATASTGAADLLARSLLEGFAAGKPVVALAGLLIITMTLSDFMNNAATAAVMCPIAISAANHFAVNTDAFLMAVAIGASCAFLTPVGHQNNTLILGPGGFRFGDYWRLGLPMEMLVVAVGLPLLLLVWPL